MKNKLITAFTAATIAAAVLMAAGTAEQVVMSKCNACHVVKKLCKHLGEKDKAAWTATVSSMIMKGAIINSEEKIAIADYLAGLKTGAEPICK